MSQQPAEPSVYPPSTAPEPRRVGKITVENICFSYADRPVLAGISFQAGAGDLVAIVGPNGCGKSTLLRILVGELRPSQGQWKIDDTPAHTLSKVTAARCLSLVPQFASAPFGYTVREMVLMARHAAHAHQSLLPLAFETAGDLQLAYESMWAADVHHLADRPVNELSGGERQRVAIARAFTQNTPIMLLDEPTSNLDLFHQLELMHHLHRITRDESRIALLVTHDLNLAIEHATRVIVMDQGKIVADAPPSAALTPEILEPVYHVKIHPTPAGLRFTRGIP